MHYYSIFDLKARTFGDLIALPTDKDAAAIRWLSMVLDQPNKTPSILQQNPEDFELHYLGEFDVESGYLDQDAKHFVCCALDVVDKKEICETCTKEVKDA